MKYEGAPDPIKFVKKEKTYLNFIEKVEKNTSCSWLLSHPIFASLQKEWSSQLPLKRAYEFIIIKHLMDNPHLNNINVARAENEVLKYVDSVSESSVLHAFQCLSQAYYDTTDQKAYVKVFELIGDTLVVTPIFNEMRVTPHFKLYLDDILTYGLIRYQEEFKSIDYGVPHFKLYETYTMREVAKLANYDKKHSAFRGSGLLTYKNDFFLFVELHKEDDIKESIKYEDKFITPQQFQWQSPNATNQESDRGQKIVNNQKHQVNLHLFVRKFKKIDNQVQPFIYLGKGNTIEASGNKPITIQLELEQEVPSQLYLEFIHKV